MTNKKTESKKKTGLVPVFCCGNKLCEAPKNTSVGCPDCCKWQHVPGKKDKYNNYEKDDK